MDVSGQSAKELLDGLSMQRHRARERRHSDVLIAALVALVSFAGAVAFAVEPAMTEASCVAPGVCESATSEYDGWALWVIAAAVAAAIVLLVRHFGGVRRATPSRWVGRVAAFMVGLPVVALFAGYGFGTLGTDMPFMFPAAAAFVVGVVAARRVDWGAAVACGLLAAIILTVGMRARTASPEWWFDNNLGYIGSSLLSGVAAATAAIRWRRAGVA